MKNNFAFMAMMAMMGESNIDNFQQEEPKLLKKQKPKEVIPKGMKYFLFRQDGTFKDYEKDGLILKEEVYFRCYAINSKNAIKKFNKFKTKKQ